MDSSNIGQKGNQIQDVPDVPPYVKNPAANNFEQGLSKNQASLRGHKSVDPRNVRGHANYK